eukprot:Opistho-1_new@104174
MHLVRHSVLAALGKRRDNCVDVQPITEEDVQRVSIPAAGGMMASAANDKTRVVAVLYSAGRDGLVASAVASALRSHPSNTGDAAGVQVQASVVRIDPNLLTAAAPATDGASGGESPEGEVLERMRRVVQVLAACDAALFIVSDVSEDYFEVIQYALEAEVSIIPVVCDAEFTHAGLRLLLNQVQWCVFSREAGAEELDTLFGSLANRVGSLVRTAVVRRRSVGSIPKLDTAIAPRVTHATALPEGKVNALRTLQNEISEPKPIFISWAHVDRDFVQHRLWKSLERAGFSCWIDVLQLEVASRWRTEIACAIKDCEYFVFVVSPDSVRSRYCREEVEFAHAQAKKIIPVVHRDAKGELERELSLRMLLSSFEPIDFASALEGLSGADLFEDGGPVRPFTTLCEYLRGVREVGVGRRREFVCLQMDKHGHYPVDPPASLASALSRMEYRRLVEELETAIEPWFKTAVSIAPFEECGLMIIGFSLCCCMCICTACIFSIAEKCWQSSSREPKTRELLVQASMNVDRIISKANEDFKQRGILFRVVRERGLAHRGHGGVDALPPEE